MKAISLPDDVLIAIERWSALDPDDRTRAELAALVANDPEAAAARFEGRIGFGTAGLRAAMGAGPTLMNRLTVRQTTAGLMRWLPPGATVVVAADARHNSADFAADTAAVVAGAGGRAELLAEPVPTPVLAYAVLDRGADAGVMITASHNPPADNGYKLYLADGIQLVDPADREISAAIDAVAVEMADPDLEIEAAGRLVPFEPGAVTVLDTADAVARHRRAALAASVTDDRHVRVLYSAMHGVGGQPLRQAFAAAGFPPPVVVAEQFEPDPDFPTVAYPNPEEDGALDLAYAAARALDDSGDPVDVILANDPDADRLAVAVPDPERRWAALTGDQVGVLLADHLLANTAGSDRLVASSIVSSRLISALAARAGAVDVRTLTGFKWVARPIVERPDHRFVLGYEEALGYCVGDRVRDKDGITAALVMAELVAGAKAVGQTLHDRLDRLAVDHGLHLTGPVTHLYPGTDGSAQREATMARLRATPPVELASVAVSVVEDLALGADLPPTNGLVWSLVDRSRVVVRPSGTEPKLKAYLEVIEPVDSPADLEPARARAGQRLSALAEAVSALLSTPDR